jgi:isoprenylcysteine carboxyl methyltransferase (ICMT) family protein YpbQ
MSSLGELYVVTMFLALMIIVAPLYRLAIITKGPKMFKTYGGTNSKGNEKQKLTIVGTAFYLLLCAITLGVILGLRLGAGMFAPGPSCS